MRHPASILIVAPQADEKQAICRRIDEKGFASEAVQVGALPCTWVPSLDLLIAAQARPTA